MVSIHNYEQRFKRTLIRISESKELSEGNRKQALAFKDYLLSEGIGLAKIERYLGDILKFNRLLGISFEKAGKEDIRRVVSAIHQEPWSEETKRCFKIMIRKLYCFIRGVERGDGYPDEVRWMRMELGIKHRKLPEELLTEEEVRALVQACRCVRDKALLATLAESGCRISEVGLMKIKNVRFETYGARISITGKTGSRKILIINATPYLQEWINSHPNNDNPESFLWISNQERLMCYSRFMVILKRAAAKAGIKKRIHPHLLRHSRATQLASIMSDSQLKNYLGWTQSSKMAGIYVHMSGKDADDAILQANNIVVEKVKKDPLLKPSLCLRCKVKNPATNRFCNSCGFILEQEAAKEILSKEQEQNLADNLMNTLLKDKEVLALIMKKINEQKEAVMP
jgi:site-specific recombinase XerD